MKYLAAMLLAVVFVSCAHRHDESPIHAHSGKVVVFDAGSSGTRVYLYQWTAEAGGIPRVAPVLGADGRAVTAKSYPGIHEFAGASVVEGQTLSAYLAPLIHLIKQHVDSQSLAQLPVYFMATGGVRTTMMKMDLTKHVDPSTSAVALLFSDVKALLQQSGLNVQKVEPLNGDIEGIYAWLAVNALNGSLYQEVHQPIRGTKGVLELGGYSFQVTYMPRDISPVTLGQESPHIYNIGLGRQRVSLYSTTYDELGLDLAASYTNWIDPGRSCFNLGPHLIPGEDMTPFEDAEPKMLSSAGCFKFIQQFVFKLARPSQGFSSSAEAENIYHAYEHVAGACFPFCGVDRAHLPEVNFSQGFYGLSNFYFIVSDFKIGTRNADGNISFTPKQVSDAADKFCPMGSAEIRSWFGPGFAARELIPRSQKACFQLNFLKVLLSGASGTHFKGLGIKENAVVTSVLEVQGQDPSWTLGAAIYEINNLLTGENQTIPTAFVAR